MANLTDKFDVLKGWHPGGDASIDHSFEPEEVAGVPVTLLPGTIVERSATAYVNAGDSTADVTPGTALPKKFYIVLEGNGYDYSTQFTDRVVCLEGNLVIRTDKIKSGDTFAVGGPVQVGSGLLEDHAGAASTVQQVGTVLANDVTANGTIDVTIKL